MVIAALLLGCAPRAATFGSELDAAIGIWWHAADASDPGLVGDCVKLSASGGVSVRAPEPMHAEWSASGPWEVTIWAGVVRAGRAAIRPAGGGWLVSWSGLLFDGADVLLEAGCDQ